MTVKAIHLRSSYILKNKTKFKDAVNEDIPVDNNPEQQQQQTPDSEKDLSNNFFVKNAKALLVALGAVILGGITLVGLSVAKGKKDIIKKEQTVVEKPEEKRLETKEEPLSNSIKDTEEIEDQTIEDQIERIEKKKKKDKDYDDDYNNNYDLDKIEKKFRKIIDKDEEFRSEFNTRLSWFAKWKYNFWNEGSSSFYLKYQSLSDFIEASIEELNNPNFNKNAILENANALLGKYQKEYNYLQKKRPNEKVLLRKLSKIIDQIKDIRSLVR